MQQYNPILERLQALAKANDDIEVLWLYGSRARGTHSENSDYDLAIAFRTEEIPAGVMLPSRTDDLMDEWKEALGADLSIVDINKIPTPLAYSVISDRYVIYCTNAFRLHSEEQRIWSKWEAYEYAHEREYNRSGVSGNTSDYAFDKN